MRRSTALALVLAGCGAAVAPVEPAQVEHADARVAESATVQELLSELRRALRARGHRERECFLAWDVEASEVIRVTVGGRTRSAGVSCGGLDALARPLEGRCPYVRAYYVSGPELATGAVALYFGPPGRAYAARPIAATGVGAAATEVVFAEPDGTQLVLGLPLRAPGGDAKQAARPIAVAVRDDNPMDDPEVARGLEQAVARVQRCNPEGGGSLVLEWNVDGEGTVSELRVVTATVSEPIVDCALETIGGVTFPEHEQEQPVDYCVPVLLDPALRPLSRGHRRRMDRTSGSTVHSDVAWRMTGERR